MKGNRYSYLCQEIHRFLLTRSVAVESRQSLLSGAGYGLFAKKLLRKDEVLTLYPGVYVPGLPLHSISDDADNVIFLGGQRTPSGKVAEENAYMLNLKGNGYIDGLALSTPEGRQLDGLHAMGHLVNHKQPSNVYVTPFCWTDVDLTAREEPPNVVRCDGSPRCLIGGEELLYNVKSSRVYGAAIRAADDVPPGHELFLDYELSKPYPKWAVGWYNCT